MTYGFLARRPVTKATPPTLPSRRGGRHLKLRRHHVAGHATLGREVPGQVGRHDRAVGNDSDDLDMPGMWPHKTSDWTPQHGQIMSQKNCLIRMPLQMGAPTMLTSNDVTNGLLHVFGCGVYVPDLDGAALESALSALPRLGIPTKHTKGGGGTTVTGWSARVGEQMPSADAEVMLSRNMPGTPVWMSISSSKPGSIQRTNRRLRN